MAASPFVVFLFFSSYELFIYPSVCLPVLSLLVLSLLVLSLLVSASHVVDRSDSQSDSWSGY